jgi:hypothetical protein
MDEAGDAFVPSTGPWELLDEAGFYHSVPDGTKIAALAAAKDLHHSDLRKLVGLERGNLKEGSHAEHLDHWTVLPHGVKYISRDGLDEPIAIFGGCRRGINHFLHLVADRRRDMPFSAKKLLELLSPTNSRASYTSFRLTSRRSTAPLIVTEPRATVCSAQRRCSAQCTVRGSTAACASAVAGA